MESESGDFCWCDRKVAYSFFTSFLRQLNQIGLRTDVTLVKIFGQLRGSACHQQGILGQDRLRKLIHEGQVRAAGQENGPLTRSMNWFRGLMRVYAVYPSGAGSIWRKEHSGTHIDLPPADFGLIFPAETERKNFRSAVAALQRKIALKQHFEAAVTFGGVQQSGAFLASD